MNSGSLRVRSLLAATLSILAALTIAGYSQLALFERYVERRVEQELDNHLRQILATIEPNEEGRLVVPMPLPDPRFGLPFSGLYWQIQEAGTVVAASPSLGDEVLALPPTVGDVVRSAFVEVPGPRGKLIVLVVRDATVQFNDSGHNLQLSAALDHSEIDTAVREFGWDVIDSHAVLAICLFVAAWFQVFVGLRPLESLRQRLAPVRTGYETQLAGRFPDEIKPLVDDLNKLLEAQQQSIARARARAGELAHGLKTPLTALNSIARDLAQRGEPRAAAEISSLVGRMQAHVGRELARAQIAVRKDRLGVAPLRRSVDQLVDALRRAPRGQVVAWIVDIDETAAIAVETDDLSELLGNLLENALKWATKRVRISADGSLPTFILIEDDGPGVPDDKLEIIRKRGAKLDDSRDGAGLGLAIVSDIADAYGWHLDLARSELGGLAARITLSSAPVDAGMPGTLRLAAE